MVAGAGLAGGLIALAFAGKRPDLRVLLVDGADHAGGNHVWSFFDSDVDTEGRALLAPLVAHRWPEGHEVRFPSCTRRLDTAYNSITSTRFDAYLREKLGDRLLLGQPVTALDATGATVADGTYIWAGAVIDARGFETPNFFARGTSSEMNGLTGCDLPEPGNQAPGCGESPASQGAGPFWGGDAPMVLDCGWQKFLGQTLRLTTPHALERPIIMDASVEQVDGYRFVYVLPLGDREIFVEDTYYSDAPQFEATEIHRRIALYAERQGWAVDAVVHEESGVLPVVKGGDFTRFWPPGDPLARTGIRSGLFHAVTGYSLPMAVALATDLARGSHADGADLARIIRNRAERHWRRQGFYRLLGRLLFDAASPPERRRIFERFYRLPAPLIERFYAGDSTPADKIRILCGRPPVPIRAAMRAFWNHLRA